MKTPESSHDSPHLHGLPTPSAVRQPEQVHIKGVFDYFQQHMLSAIWISAHQQRLDSSYGTCGGVLSVKLT